MLFHVESQRIAKGISLRYLASLLRERGHRLTKDGLRLRAQGDIAYTMEELVDIAQLLRVKLEDLYTLEPHEFPTTEEEPSHA